MDTLFNQFTSGIFFPVPHVGLFSVKILNKFLAIKDFSVNETMSGQPNKHLIHWHFENKMASFFMAVVFLQHN